MKLHEIASAPGNDAKRLYMLKRMFEIGQAPEIANATYMRGHFSWGDLEKLGFAERGSEPTRSGANEWWTFTGPGSIIVVTRGMGNEEHKQVLKSGESTDPVEVDYS
jgi:hypothetical protein